MFKVGDIVSRKSYNSDINFEIVKIENNIVDLSAIDFRLKANAHIDDLTAMNIKVKKDMALRETEYFENVKYNMLNTKKRYIKGKVLHIDGDKSYLNKCEKLYKLSKVYCNSVYIKELEMKNHIKVLMEKYNPDIVVVTGHDSFNNKDIKEIENYRSSKYFVDVVKEIRKNAHKDEVFIIAGACQSHFEALIAAGSNFAFSPKRVNIHAYDPTIVAIIAANTSFDKMIDVKRIFKHTYINRDGLGGIESYGKLRILI